MKWLTTSQRECEIFFSSTENRTLMCHNTYCLQYHLTSTTVDIVLGDFNINYFNDNQVEHLRSLMHSLNFIQIVTKPTFCLLGAY